MRKRVNNEIITQNNKFQRDSDINSSDVDGHADPDRVGSP